MIRFFKELWEEINEYISIRRKRREFRRRILAYRKSVDEQKRKIAKRI